LPKRQSIINFVQKKNGGLLPGKGGGKFGKMWIDCLEVEMMFPDTISPPSGENSFATGTN
jgi:hypothetical protein